MISNEEIKKIAKLSYLEIKDEEMEEIPAASSETIQGSLEQSNVNAVEEMINLLDSYRSYESCLKVIQSNDSLDSKAVNELGRL